MPKVGNKKYPYTKAGKAAAKSAKSKITKSKTKSGKK